MNVKDIMKIYSEKEKVEDTHTRTTFLMRNDLKEKLDEISKNKKGFKTYIINKAIEEILKQL